MKPGRIRRGDDPAPVASALVFLMIGPLLWAGHLFLAYALQAALCAFRITGVASVDPPVIEGVVVVLTVVAAAALLYGLWRPHGVARLLRASALLDGDNGTFMISVMRLLSALSLAGVLWAGATVMLLQACPQLR